MQRKKRTSIDWVLDRQFPDKKTADDFRIAEKMWAFYYKNNANRGWTYVYRCNAVKFRSKQCAAMVSCLYHAESDEVSFFRSAESHNHDDSEIQLAFKYSDEAKKLIIEVYFYRNFIVHSVLFILFKFLICDVVSLYSM